MSSHESKTPGSRSESKKLAPMHAPHDMEAYKRQVQVQAAHHKALNRHWWFISAVLPLICAATAPLANLFTVLAFFEPWVVFTQPILGQKAHNTAL